MLGSVLRHFGDIIIFSLSYFDIIYKSIFNYFSYAN